MHVELRTNWEYVDRSSGFTGNGILAVSTWRLKVPGGWIYKIYEQDEDHPPRITTCFVPAPPTH